MKSAKKSVIVIHGKSEWHLCRCVGSNLRIPQMLIGRDNGASSIQVSGLLKFFHNDGRFKTVKSFADYFCIDVVKDKKFPVVIFTIMDLDDCRNVNEKNAYIDGSMFNKNWFAPYVVPIYNYDNLEVTMKSCGYEVQNKKDYCKIFPINHRDLDLKMAKELCSRLQRSTKTNMEVYLQYCIDRAEENLLK